LLSFCPVSILGVDIPSPIMPPSQGLKLLSVGIIAFHEILWRERERIVLQQVHEELHDVVQLQGVLLCTLKRISF
jgi:hypothetical protein